MYRGAMRAMLSELARTDRLVVTQDFAVEAPKTKHVVQKLKDLSLESALILVEAFEEKLFLAARNLPHVQVMPVAALDPVSLARFDKVVVTVGALKLLEERLA